MNTRFSIGGVRDLSRSLGRQSVLVAAVCLLADVVGFVLVDRLSQMHAADWVVLAAIVVADAALALPARLSGWVALLHATVAVVTAALLDLTKLAGLGEGSGMLIAGYRAGAWLRGWAAYLSLIALLVSVIAAHLIGWPQSYYFIPVEMVKDAVLPWLVGRYTTARRGRLAELDQRAENARRDASSAIERAVAEERSAIARDLHDVISHHVSAIGVHAGAARLRLDTAPRPADIAESLNAVETSSRSAMADLRRLLDLLHGDGSDGSRQPGLDNLEDLLGGYARGGPSIQAEHSRSGPPTARLAGYRALPDRAGDADQRAAPR